MWWLHHFHLILFIIIQNHNLHTHLSSVEVVFCWGRLLLRLSSVEFVFCWGCLLLRLSSFEVVFCWGCFLLRLSSVKVVFCWCCLPLKMSYVDFSSIFFLSLQTSLQWCWWCYWEGQQCLFGSKNVSYILLLTICMHKIEYK